jgi:hypothetical protein
MVYVVILDLFSLLYNNLPAVSRLFLNFSPKNFKKGTAFAVNFDSRALWENVLSKRRGFEKSP